MNKFKAKNNQKALYTTSPLNIGKSLRKLEVEDWTKTHQGRKHCMKVGKAKMYEKASSLINLWK